MVFGKPANCLLTPNYLLPNTVWSFLFPNLKAGNLCPLMMYTSRNKLPRTYHFAAAQQRYGNMTTSENFREWHAISEVDSHASQNLTSTSASFVETTSSTSYTHIYFAKPLGARNIIVICKLAVSISRWNFLKRLELQTPFRRRVVVDLTADKGTCKQRNRSRTALRYR
jgi:hypothetical protein